MSACVESLFYAGREAPWHGLGTQVNTAPNSSDAIELAGLNWKVESQPIFDQAGREILGYKSNVRDSDNSVLGIVTDRYRIVQNAEAFEFTDSLVGEGLVYETAGSLRNGKTIWLLGKLEPKNILGDRVDPYICFANTHDGTGAIRVCLTPTRVVCQNTLNIALENARRSWSAKHMGDISSKLEEARTTLKLADFYYTKLSEEAEKLVNIKVTDDDIQGVLDELFPINKDKDTDRKINNIKDLKDAYMVCYMMPDIKQFKGTAWGAINAMADMVDHAAPGRLTDVYQENNWGRVMNGHPILDKFYASITTLKV